MVDVFISYKKERRAHAERLAQILEAHGYEVWWDYELAVGPIFVNRLRPSWKAPRPLLFCGVQVQLNPNSFAPKPSRGQPRQAHSGLSGVGRAAIGV